MARNPFITKTEWKTTKTKYFIPDKIIKSGSFGEKMNALYDAFEKEKLESLTKQKVPIAIESWSNLEKIFDDWLNNAKTAKAEKFNNKEKKDGEKNKAQALQELYSQGIRNHLGAKFHEALTA